MISSRKDLDRYIKKDNNKLFSNNRKQNEKYIKRIKDPRYLIILYLRYLRKEEYYINCTQKNLVYKLLFLVYARKRNRIGEKIGFNMEPNCFEEGLTIFHTGSIVVNCDAKIGKNCCLHGNNCIGNNGITNKCPKIGNNVDIGFGAVLIGDIEIADDIKIGANAVVNKSFLEKGITIAGVPACRVK